MKVELFPFQTTAVKDLRYSIANSLEAYRQTLVPQVVSFTAPTGSGKTIIMASLMEEIFNGDVRYDDQPNAIFLWISDSPELNTQSKDKIDRKADRIALSQTIAISDESFDQEMLDDGHIYFLNTQKLGKSSNLTKHSDNREYTIWETLNNTIKNKSDRLYLIIDEAHRGMVGKDASKATSIMQKFIKGSKDEIDPFPVIIGMSATVKRFNELVGETNATIRKVIVTTEQVRASGLLKDRIIVTYPEKKTINRDMAVLQAAADAWKDKWDHWTQYCREQHYAYVNPMLIVQVQNGSGDKITDTNLDDCIQLIENRTGFQFKEGEVVHTFGQTTADIEANGLKIKYEEPSRINDDKQIKVVFFKENLSTGWDAPRAETMVSFRRAVDSTYIAQLLGRMIRTPLRMHINVDETLNDVKLFLPYFDQSTVQEVLDALHNSEGGSIPSNVYGEAIGKSNFTTLSIHPSSVHRSYSRSKVKEAENQLSFFDDPDDEVSPKSEDKKIKSVYANSTAQNNNHVTSTINESSVTPSRNKEKTETINNVTHDVDKDIPDINREAVIKAINSMGLLTYNVRTAKITNYLSSLFKLAHLLTQSGLYAGAVDEVLGEIVGKIREYIKSIKDDGTYDVLEDKARNFELTTQSFDVFGEKIQGSQNIGLYSTTQADIDRQFRLAEIKLGNEGVGVAYGNKYYDDDDPDAFKIHVILYATDNECRKELFTYAENKFHELDDAYRKYTINESEQFRKQYDRVVSDGDFVSKHNFRLPETISVSSESKGKKYYDHLFVNDLGYAQLDLNSWEQGVIAEEEKKPDFVCWLRNPPRKPWSLTIPYKLHGDEKPAYPDFIIVRRDNKSKLGYIVDILEPHNPALEDNLGKAQGFARYAQDNIQLGKIEIIRQVQDKIKNKRFKRLDMTQSVVRDKVLHAVTLEELNHIFDEYGTF
ncbi:restriction endonuclease subunit R [Lactobacillus amylolyticus]|uniref:DEAD/DEAH box helicase n=1 Tax=Lactobacillus amylolyticus TaxID=83683 RepID=UPI0009B991F6|nr:DEAD/DEAH box helicase family protein [Lactobacillus amylolyticus]ARD06163.1 restriction endonuclease subunit R [Lactobacillus amylolyticus]